MRVRPSSLDSSFYLLYSIKTDWSVFIERKQMPRTTAEYEQTQRDRIIDGAALAFASYSYRQITMEQIAQSLGLSKGAIYIYFKSKEELFVAAIRSYNVRRFENISTSYRSDQPVITRLENMLDQFSLLLSPDEKIYVRLWLEGFLEAEHIPALQAIKTESYRQFSYLLHSLLIEGQQDGTFDSGLDMSSLTSLFMATFDGLLLHALLPDRGITPETVRHSVRQSFFKLLAKTS